MLRDVRPGFLSDAVLHPTLTAAISGVEKKNFSNIDVMLSIFLCTRVLKLSLSHPIGLGIHYHHSPPHQVDLLKACLHYHSQPAN